MFIDFFIEQFNKNDKKIAMVWENKLTTYGWLVNRITFWKDKLKKSGITFGSRVVLDATFSPESISIIFALIESGCIIIPLFKPKNALKEEIFHECKVNFLISFKNSFKIEPINKEITTHQLFDQLYDRKHPGLILISSGTSGKPKAAVHDFLQLLKKFHKPGKKLTILNFLLFDHWGGLNTMFYTLSNVGTLVSTDNRSTDNVCKIIQEYNIELLPTSPTFLKLLLLSESYKKYDLTSLKIISYGTESMPMNILTKINKIFPQVKIKQTYGLIEIGVLDSKSEKNNSLWIKLDSQDYKTRVIDGILQIKSNSTMLGYLNAPNPFTEDGWFITGDRVEIKNEYFKILGRNSDLINVGGEKVYPDEVEKIIETFENVADVTIYGEKNTILGNIVCAKITLKTEEDHAIFIKKLKNYCKSKLAKFKVPIKIVIIDKIQYNYRFKKIIH
jgi:acyl-CoA synthetase (AMP-forming)/AMP-acid ligase II